MPRQTQNRTLTEGAFHAFLAWLSPQKIEDGEAYEKARNRLIIFFACRQCREPESLTDITIDRAILKLAEIPAEAQPIAYLFGIARKVLLEYRRREAENDQTTSADTQIYQNHSRPEVERHHACLERCLNELSRYERNLLLDYYSHNKGAKIEMHRELAKRLNLNPNALRNRVFRLNQRMARCVKGCLEKLSA